MFQRFHEAKSMQESEMNFHPSSTTPVTEINKVLNLNSNCNSQNLKKTQSSLVLSRSVANTLVGITHKRPHIDGVIHGNELSSLQVKEEITLFSIISNDDNKFNVPAHAAALEVLSSLKVSRPLLTDEGNSKVNAAVPTQRDKADGENSEENEPHFSCNICSQIFKNSNHLKNHYWRHAGVKPFECDICHSTFTQLTNLKTHQRIHTGERPFECFECGATFTQISNLKTHQKLHTGEKPFVCEMCHARFTQQSNLKSHRLIHTGERPFKCEYCDASFVQSTHLRNHQRIHTNEKPYSCEHCSSSFRQLSNLRTHEKTHTGEKPFICEECGIGFVQKSNLKAHRLKLHSIVDSDPPNRRGRKGNHGGVGPFICSQCSAEFSSSANLRAHYRVHSGEKPFQCTTCFTSFAQKSNLKAHELTHSDTRPYVCSYCPSSFKQKGNLRTHTLKKHNGVKINVHPFSTSSNVRSAVMSGNVMQLSNDTLPSSAFSEPLSLSSTSATGPFNKLIKQNHHRIFVINESKNSDKPIVQIDGNTVIV